MSRGKLCMYLCFNLYNYTNGGYGRVDGAQPSKLHEVVLVVQDQNYQNRTRVETKGMFH
jgi:hypothetical protein